MAKIVVKNKRYDHVEMQFADDLFTEYHLQGIAVEGTLLAGNIALEFETHIPKKALEGRTVEEVILKELFGDGVE